MKKTFETKTGKFEFTLKNVKFLENGHGDTPTFTADLYIDGKKAALVRNDGWGGESEYVTYGCNKEASAKIEWTHPNNNDGEYLFTEFDCEVMELATLTYEVKKYQTKQWVLTKGEGMGMQLFTVKFPMVISKLKKHRDFTNWRDNQVKKFQEEGFKVMNTNLGL